MVEIGLVEVDVGVLSQREGHVVVDGRCLLVTGASKQVQRSMLEGCSSVMAFVACMQGSSVGGQVMLWPSANSSSGDLSVTSLRRSPQACLVSVWADRRLAKRQ